jgi:hypothetical protein
MVNISNVAQGTVARPHGLAGTAQEVTGWPCVVRGQCALRARLSMARRDGSACGTADGRPVVPLREVGLHRGRCTLRTHWAWRADQRRTRAAMRGGVPHQRWRYFSVEERHAMAGDGSKSFTIVVTLLRTCSQGKGNDQ